MACVGAAVLLSPPEAEAKGPEEDPARSRAVEQTCSGWVGDILLKVDTSYQGLQRVQSALRILGYDPGVVDGQWGRNTQTAMNDFQAAHDLDVTSEIDEVTTNTIFSLFDARNGDLVYLASRGVLRRVEERRLDVQARDEIHQFSIGRQTRIQSNKGSLISISDLITGSCVDIVSRPPDRIALRVVSGQ